MNKQLPKLLEVKKPNERWDWFDRQKDILAKAVELDGSVTMSGERLEAFVHMMRINDLSHCKTITMHHNAVVVMACAAIEDDPNMTSEWLFNALDQSDCTDWQMYESAEEFNSRNRLEWPDSIEDHRKNIKANKLIAQEDAVKFEAWQQAQKQ